MCPDPPRERKFYSQLLAIDVRETQEVRARRCPRCGGRLDTRNYPRKPRGGPPGLGDEHTTRLSLCCAVDGCRKGVTPESARFLGRKVYLGVIVVLMSALASGVTPARARKLREETGVSARTLGRWRTWWLADFRGSRFWKASRGRFSPPVDGGELPSSLVARFLERAASGLVDLLRFLSPITTASAPKCQPV